MKNLRRLATLSLKLLLGDRLGVLFDVTEELLTTPSQRLEQAIRQAHVDAWTSLRIVLGGRTWWQRFFQPRTTEVAEAMENFLRDVSPKELEMAPPSYSHKCLQQLKQATEQGYLPWPSEAEALTRHELTTSLDRVQLIKQEEETVHVFARELISHGWSDLAELVQLHPPKTSRSLLALAVHYFLRSALERDEKLAAMMTYDQTVALDRQTQAGFNGLRETLTTHADEVRKTLQTLDDKLDLLAGGVDRLSTQMDLLLLAASEIRDRLDELEPKSDPLHIVGPTGQQKVASQRKLVELPPIAENLRPSKNIAPINDVPLSAAFLAEEQETNEEVKGTSTKICGIVLSEVFLDQPTKEKQERSESQISGSGPPLSEVFFD